MKYNQADIENLKFLMDFAYDKMKEKQFIRRLKISYLDNNHYLVTII